MNLRRVQRRDERGASLILVIAFMLVVGAISAAVISATTSAFNGRTVLDQARNREYAADAAIETSIARIRTSGGTCGAQAAPLTLDAAKIHVDCVATPAVVVDPGGVLLSQNDLTFTACLFSGSGNGNSCTSSNTIINAEVNFQGSGSPLTTYVLAWSVNA